MTHDPRYNGSASLDALLDAAVDAIIISDDEGTIVQFNSAAERLFGYAAADIIGQNLTTLMPPPDRNQHGQYMSRYLNSGQPAIIGIGREVTGLHASGRTVPVHLSVGEIKSGGRERFVGILRDLSEQKKYEAAVITLESQLAHADRLVALGELTAGMAHEINQPLTAIAAFSDAGARLIDNDNDAARTELKNICGRISQQARRAGDVIARLRRLSQKGELSKSSHDLQRLVQSALQLFDHEVRRSNAAIATHFNHRTKLVPVDEIQIQQVLVNLIKNSLDALAESATEPAQVHVHVEEEDEHLYIIVEDNGPGVDPENEPHLFEPFFTTKDHGVGLGLSICRNIAVAHGGNLRYKRSERGGARFTLSLPLTYIG
ncbi:MAG: PAS domain S-box protein [Gammaproteobacteria bacterium]|nr:PAS domain S-box protein [Gammaproteobacteria bacterium]